MGIGPTPTRSGHRAFGLRLSAAVLLLVVGCARTKATVPETAEAVSEENTPEVLEVLEKHIQAIGGRAAQLSIKSSESEYVFLLVDSLHDSKVEGKIYEIREKTTGRFYSRTTDRHGTAELGFDGTRAWDRTPMHRGYLLRSDPQFRDLVQKRPEIYEYKETGQQFVRSPNEMVGGNECLVLKSRSRAADPDGRVKSFWVRYYFDPQSYLLHRILVESEVRQTIDFDDFREVEGTTVPFLKASRNPRVKLVWNLKSLKYNVPVDPTRFEFEGNPKKEEAN
jgi:hypothetical protein